MSPTEVEKRGDQDQMVASASARPVSVLAAHGDNGNGHDITQYTIKRASTPDSVPGMSWNSDSASECDSVSAKTDDSAIMNCEEKLGLDGFKIAQQTDSQPVTLSTANLLKHDIITSVQPGEFDDAMEITGWHNTGLPIDNAQWSVPRMFYHETNEKRGARIDAVMAYADKHFPPAG
jgi:hypothetical protein